MDYSAAMEYIAAVSKNGSIFGTETEYELLRRLGDPQNDLNVIHVAGTNGKGSICTYLEYGLRECGFSVGRYISPTLFSYLERFQIDGKYMSEDEFAFYLTRIQNAACGTDTDKELSPSAFELETAAAFLYFADKRPDYVILECGMGGRDDATNVLRAPAVTVFSSISMDHMNFLGSDPLKIAENKAGIMRPGVPAVVARQPDVSLGGRIYNAGEALKRSAEDIGAPIIMCGETKEGEDMLKEAAGRLAGAAPYQLEDMEAAVMAFRSLFDDEPDSDMKRLFIEGLSKAFWPGRYEKMYVGGGLIIRDGAHNPDAVRRLREALISDPDIPDGTGIHLIMGTFRDKDYMNELELMLPIAASFTAVTPPEPVRALDKAELKKAAEYVLESEGIKGVTVRCADDINGAVNDILSMPGGKKVIAIFGSLSLMQLM